jgi:hypothetical protein
MVEGRPMSAAVNVACGDKTYGPGGPYVCQRERDHCDYHRHEDAETVATWGGRHLVIKHKPASVSRADVDAMVDRLAALARAELDALTDRVAALEAARPAVVELPSLGDLAETINDLRADYYDLVAQNEELTRQRDDARRERDRYRAHYEAVSPTGNAELRGRVAGLQDALDGARLALIERDARIAQLEGLVDGLGRARRMFDDGVLKVSAIDTESGPRPVQVGDIWQHRNNAEPSVIEGFTSSALNRQPMAIGHDKQPMYLAPDGTPESAADWTLVRAAQTIDTESGKP